jgi:hypothetical protein
MASAAGAAGFRASLDLDRGVKSPDFSSCVEGVIVLTS